MNSPVSPSTPLERTKIEPGLSVYRCPDSDGLWIPMQEYLIWIERRAAVTDEPDSIETPELIDDSERGPLFCPESGAILIRYRVGHGLTFQIDRSPVTGGIWLDRGEWDALKTQGLHRELHRIFTAPYQNAIRAEAHRDQMILRFRERIGDDDFEKARRFKEWMLAHENAADIRAFLLDTEL